MQAEVRPTVRSPMVGLCFPCLCAAGGWPVWVRGSQDMLEDRSWESNRTCALMDVVGFCQDFDFHSELMEDWAKAASESALMKSLWLQWREDKRQDQVEAERRGPLGNWRVDRGMRQWWALNSASAHSPSAFSLEKSLLGVWKALCYKSPWTWAVNYPPSSISTPWHGSLLGCSVPCYSCGMAINNPRFCSHLGNSAWRRPVIPLITTLSCPHMNLVRR